MGSTYAWLVDCPRLFHDEKKVILAPSIQGAFEYMEKELSRRGLNFRIDSIVLVGEVLNGEAWS